MDSEERLDLNEKRINNHAERLARMEEVVKSIDDKVTSGFVEVKSEMRTYFGPIRDLTKENSEDILTVRQDVDWIKPWFKRGLWIAGASLGSVIILLVKVVLSIEGTGGGP